MKTKVFTWKSKIHGLTAEWLGESISVRLQSELSASLKQSLRLQIKAMVAAFHVDLIEVRFTPKTVKIMVSESQDGILNPKKIRTALRQLVTTVSVSPFVKF